MKEQDQKQKSSKEKLRKGLLYGGLIAGAIGLILSPELVLFGGAAALTGVVFESKKSKSKQQTSAA